MWIYMAVLNTGLQMLACMLLGWACACFRLVDAEQLSRQLNDFAVKVSIPAFILHLLGIKSDLRDAEAWRALGVYLLWALLLQAACMVYMQLRRGSTKRWQRLGSSVLLLTANNTGLVGTPVVTAALGPQVSSLGLLIGMLVTLEMLPLAVTCFEWQRWQQHPPEVLVALSRAASRSFLRRRTSTCSSYRPSTSNDPAAAATAASAGAPAMPRRAASPVPEYMGQGDVSLPVLWTAPSLPSPLTPAPSTLLGAQLSSALEGGTSGRPSGQFASAGACSGRTSGEGQEAGGAGSKEAARAPVRQRSSMLQELQRKLQLWSSPSGQLQPPETAPSEAEGAGLRAPSAAVFSSTRQQAPSAVDLVRGSYVATGRPTGGHTSIPCDSKEQGLSMAGDPGTAAFEFSCLAGTTSCSGAASSPPTDRSNDPVNSISTVSSRNAGTESTGHGNASLLETGDNSSSGSNDHTGAEMALSVDGTKCHNEAVEHASVSNAAAEMRCLRTAAAAVPAVLPPAAAAVQRSAAQLLHVSSFREWTRAPESPFATQPTPPPTPAAALVRESAAIHASGAAAGPQAPAHGAGDGHQQQQQPQEQLSPRQQEQQHRSKHKSRSDGGVSCSQRSPRSSPGESGVVEALVTVEIVSLGPSKAPLPKADCSSQQIAACTSPRQKQGLEVTLGVTGDQSAVSDVQGVATKQAGQQLQPWAAGESRTPSTMGSAGCFMTFLMVHPQLKQLVTLQAKNHLLWFNLAALLISLSGLRRWLDPASPDALPALGWVEGTLRWGSATCVPTMLFANGVWMYGKPIISRRTGAEVGVYILLRMLLLPGAMALICILFGLRDVRGMALVVLACAPVAQLAFVLSQQYDAGAEVVTGVIILGIVVMLPHIIGVLQLAKATGLFVFELQATAS